MHVLGEDQKHGNKSRTSPERSFKRINTFVLAVNLACFLIVISQVSIAANKTVQGSIWFPIDFSLHPIIAVKTANCSVNLTESVGGWSDVPSTISPYDRDHRFAELTGNIVTAISAHAVMILIGAINKLAFDLNFFHWRYRYVILRKDILTMLEFVFMTMSFWLALEPIDKARHLRNYLKTCRVVSKNSLPYVVPMIPIIFNVVFTLFFHLISLIFLLKNGLKKKKPTQQQGPALQQQQQPNVIENDGM